MTTLPQVLRSDFGSLLPGSEVSVDEEYIITKDPATGVEDIFQYRLVAPSPTQPTDLFIKSSDANTPHEKYAEFWARRLNFKGVGQRVDARLSALLDGTRFIEPVLRLRSLSDDSVVPLECFEDAFVRTPEDDNLRLLFVSADGGRGKSTLLRKRVVDAVRFAPTPLHLFVDVHGKSFASLAEHIAFELDTVAPWIAYDGFIRLLALGAARLVFDGFDELGVELGEDVVFERLRSFVDDALAVRAEHVKLFAPRDAVRIVIAGRTQYFGNVNLRQRVQGLANASSFVEFEPWPVERAVDFVSANVPSAEGEYLIGLREGLSRIEPHREIYQLAVHPVALKMFAEARFKFELVEIAQAAGGFATVRGLVRLLELAVQALLQREEAKHISPAQTSLFPISVQKAVLEQTCAELLKSGENPLSFDAFYVEYAASAVAQESALDKEATRRLVGAAPQHVIFGLGSLRPGKTLGFPHQTVFEVIAGWAVSERLAAGTAAGSSLLQAKYLGDELLATVALRLQSMPQALVRLADLTQQYLCNRGDPTATWNLTKLCFDRRLVDGSPARPSSGAWDVKGAAFVQIGFDPSALEGAHFTNCEFSLCEIALPIRTSVTFVDCLWHQCSLLAVADSKADIRRDCRIIVVSPVLFGRELPVVSDIEELEDAVRPISTISFSDRQTPVRQLTELQKRLLRFAKEASKRGNFRIEEVRQRITVEDSVAREYVARLRELGFVKERHVPYAGRDTIYSVSGDVVRAAENMFARGEFES